MDGFARTLVFGWGGSIHVFESEAQKLEDVLKRQKGDEGFYRLTAFRLSGVDEIIRAGAPEHAMIAPPKKAHREKLPADFVTTHCRFSPVRDRQ